MPGAPNAPIDVSQASAPVAEIPAAVEMQSHLLVYQNPLRATPRSSSEALAALPPLPNLGDELELLPALPASRSSTPIAQHDESPVCRTPEDIWRHVADAVANPQDARNMVLALRVAHKSLHANTIGMADSVLLAKKLDTYVQAMKDEPCSDANWARFDILVDALTKKALKKIRFPDPAKLTIPKLGLVSREKSHSAITAPSLIRRLPLAKRSAGFQRLVELVRIVDTKQRDPALVTRFRGLKNLAVKPTVAARLAIQIDYLPEGQDRVRAFDSIAGLIDELGTMAAEQEITPALANQIAVVLTDSARADRFNALADTIDAMENPAAKLMLATGLAKSMTFLDRREVADGFQRTATMMDNLGDANAKAQLAAVLARQIIFLSTEDIPGVFNAQRGFNRIWNVAESLTERQAKSAVVTALAERISFLPPGPERDLSFERTLSSIRSLDLSLEGKASLTAILVDQIAMFEDDEEREVRYAQIVEIMNTLTSVAAASIIAAALARQIGRRPLVALEVAGEQIIQPIEERRRLLQHATNTMANLPDVPAKARIAVAVARVIRHFPEAVDRINLFNNMATVMDRLTDASAKSEIAAALAEQIGLFQEERADFVNRLREVMNSASDAGKASIAAALARQIELIPEGEDELFDSVKAVMETIGDPAAKTKVAAALANQLEFLPPNLVADHFKDLALILSGLSDASLKAELVVALANNIAELEDHPSEVESFNQVLREINNLTDPEGDAAIALADHIDLLPQDAQLDAFRNLTATINVAIPSDGIVGERLARQISNLPEARDHVTAFTSLAQRLNSVTDPEGNATFELARRLVSLPPDDSLPDSFGHVARILEDMVDSAGKARSIQELTAAIDSLPVNERRLECFLRLAGVIGNMTGVDARAVLLPDLINRIGTLTGIEGWIAAFNSIADIIEGLPSSGLKLNAVMALMAEFGERPGGFHIDQFNRAVRMTEGLPLSDARRNAIAILINQIANLPPQDSLVAMNQVADMINTLQDGPLEMDTALAFIGQIALLPPADQIAGFTRSADVISNLADQREIGEALARLSREIHHLPMDDRFAGFNLARQMIAGLTRVAGAQGGAAAVLVQQVRHLPEEARFRAFTNVSAIVVPLRNAIAKGYAATALARQIMHLPADRRHDAFQQVVEIITPLTGQGTQINPHLALARQISRLPDHLHLGAFHQTADIIAGLTDPMTQADAAAGLAAEIELMTAGARSDGIQRMTELIGTMASEEGRQRVQGILHYSADAA